MKDKNTNKTICLLFGLFFALILGGWCISADVPVLQAAQEHKEMEQELPAGGVDEIKGYRVSSEAAEQVPSYENQLSFFIRTKSVFEAGTGDYGYHCLSDNEKAFYMSLEISLRNFENSEDAEFTEVEDGIYTPFKVDYASKNLSADEASRVWRVFLTDHPGLFWVGSSYWWTSDYLMPGVAEEYGNNPSLIKTIYSKIEDGVTDYLDAVSEVDNTYEKVRIIYDMIIRNVDYAYQSDGTTPESANWAHSIVGVFDGVHKSVVCEGYAKTFTFLLNILDIPSIYIAGATESDGGGRHVWNAVSFDGGDTYCYMDATWDDTGKKGSDQPENLYIYFAMPKSMFEKRHFADGPESGYWRYDLPPMNDDMEKTYFRVYGAYGMEGSVTDDKSAKEFLKKAGALSPEQGWLRLLVDTDTYDKIRSGLGTTWRYNYAQENDYKMVWAELPEDVCVTIPARELMLSPTNIHIDMNSPESPACVQINRITANSDDYIQIYSTNEKVITVNTPYVKAKQGECFYLSARGAGTAAVYAKSAAGEVTDVCNVVVEQEAAPSPTPTLTPTPSPTPSDPPFSSALRNPRVNSDGVTTWDCVYFGNYWQEDTNGDGTADQNDAKTPIKWRVLSVDGDDVFLLADKNLDCQTYNDTRTDVTWETCTMRSWLNGYGAEENQDGNDYSDDNFLDNAFSKSEQSVIRTTNVVNDDNPEYGAEGGNDTSDKVYLLSIDEVTNPAYGFSSDFSKYDEARRAKNTEYAKAQGAWTNTSEEYAGNGVWWLRSPGLYSCASDVYIYGDVFRYGNYVNNNNLAARAALHINLKASPDAISDSSWTYAGTVASDGTEESALRNPSTTSDGVTTWDCVYFGNYWQEDTNGDGKVDKNDAKTPIKWRVLSVDGDDVFLLADKNLDCKMYNDTDTNITWETCTMRSWLNGYGAEENQDGKDYSDDNFLDNAFSRSEQSAICTTNVVNDDNPEYGTEGGNDTSDKVYLLSMDEVTNPAYGFLSDYSKDDEGRKAKNTEYAKTQGAYTATNEEYAGNGYWWLRSPGYDSNWASSVSSNGIVNRFGDYVYINYIIKAVRPTLHLNLSSASNWTYAGTVTPDGKVEEPGPTPKPTVTPGETEKPGTTPTPKPTVTPGKTEKPGTTSTPKPSASAAPTGQPDVPPTAMPGEFTGKLKNPTTDADGTVTWDCVYFGNYWQEDTNGDGKADKNDEKQPIKWRVLSVDGDDAFLVADKNLDCQRYNDTYTDVTWETCTMRSWLNGYGAKENQNGKDYSNDNFFGNAFSRSEQSAISTTRVVNNDNPEYGTEGGNDTSDKVYLLSIDEVMNPEYGFTSSTDATKTREAVNTAYVAGGGEIGLEGWMADAGSAGYWWLRSPGDESNCASDVSSSGLLTVGWNVDTDDEAVRPALHLNLKALPDAGSSSNWSYAGTITSEGEESGTATPTPRPEATEEPADTPTEKPSVEPSATAVPTDRPDIPPTVTPGEFTGKLKDPAKDADGTVTWDCVYFGNYWQEDTNGDGKADKSDAKTPIKWRVLSVNGDDAFLVADQNLDCQLYNDTNTDVTWETCTMRSWLNGYGANANKDGKNYGGNNFLRNAFSETEQAAIKTTKVVNNDNPEYGTEGGKDTSDKVYLLSTGEVTNLAYGFSGSSYDLSRAAKTTEYAKAQGVWADDPADVFIDNGCWWLRSPGEHSDDALYVGVDGSVNDYDVGGNEFFGNEYAARPALHLNLKALSDDASNKIWSYAGTVTAESRAEEPEESEEPEKPSETDKPFTPTPGTPSQPGTSFVMPPVPQPVSPAAPESAVSADAGKSAVRKVTALKIKQKKRTVTLSWKKQTGAKGYQICYSMSGKWKGKKQKLVTKNNAVIKNLKKNKTYYFRVRAYRREGTKKVYGAWSSVKKIRIKK